MISDVLSDAVREIERYENSMPEVYAELSEEIAKVKEAMNSLRRKLDAVPDKRGHAFVSPMKPYAS